MKHVTNDNLFIYDFLVLSGDSSSLTAVILLELLLLTHHK